MADHACSCPWAERTRCENVPRYDKPACGAPARWVGHYADGCERAFCDACAVSGADAVGVASWSCISSALPDVITEELAAERRAAWAALWRPFRSELTAAGEQLVVPGCERNASPRAKQLSLWG